MAGQVLIVGGGIGGLSAGLALHRAGVSVKVIEKMDALQSVGGALQVWANGMQALARMGVADTVAGQANAVEAWAFRSWRRGELLRVPIGDYARRYGVERPQLTRRADLVQALTDALGRDRIEFGAVYESFAQDEDGVTVDLADGRQLRGSVLVGADGIDSTVRASIAPTAAPHYAGYRYVRALVPVAADPDEPDPGVFVFTLGHGDRFGTYPRGRDWLYWFAVVVTKQPDQGRGTDGKADLLERFGAFPGPIPGFVESTPAELIVGQDIRDLPSPSRWCDGRVTLLGDAAHAMTPNLGRGASESIEDAEDLAGVLSAIDIDDGRAVSIALQGFERRRRSAIMPIQQRSHRIGEITSWQYPFSSPLRDTVMRHVVSRKMNTQIRDEIAAIGARSPS